MASSSKFRSGEKEEEEGAALQSSRIHGNGEAALPPSSSSSPSSSAAMGCLPTRRPSPTPTPPITTRVQSPSPSPPSSSTQREGGSVVNDRSESPATPAHPDDHTSMPRQTVHRSISTPLSHRMGDLRHPRPSQRATSSYNEGAATSRNGLASPQAASHSATSSSIRHTTSVPSPSSSSPLHEDLSSPSALAQHILDTLQLPISHLLHTIPHHLLEESQEMLSATSLHVPVATVQAVLEAFRGLNWISGRVATHPSDGEPSRESSFDLVELVQRAADVVSGQAADKGIEVVLLSDNSSNPTSSASQLQVMANGDVGAVRCLLIHTMSRYIDLSPKGSTVEVDLLLEKNQIAFALGTQTPSGAMPPRSELFAPEGYMLQLAGADWAVADGEKLKGRLSFPSIVASLAPPGAPTSTVTTKTDAQEKIPHLSRPSLAEDPTPTQLSNFAAFELKDQRAALHADSESPFAAGLTDLLQRFGCEVTRIATGDHGEGPGGAAAATTPAKTAIALSGGDGRPALVEYKSDLAKEISSSGDAAGEKIDKVQAVLDPVSGVPVMLGDKPDGGYSTAPVSPAGSAQPSSVPMERNTTSGSANSNASTVRATSPSAVSSGGGDEMPAFSFLMIDDDVEVLQQELLRMRSALPILRTALGQTTPHPDNAAAVASAEFPLDGRGPSTSVSPPRSATQAIIFFSSLATYRSIKDLVQRLLEGGVQAPGDSNVTTPSDVAANALLPEIVVIPKPAGARRILTALHTAVRKPFVDAAFTPIATSPSSPHLWGSRTRSSTNTKGTSAAASPSHESKGNTPAPPQQDVSPSKKSAPSSPSQQSAWSAATPASPPRSSANVPTSPRRSPNRRGPGMKIPNFPRTDPASVMASTPSLPTPLRQELSRSNSSEGGNEEEAASPTMQQHASQAGATLQPQSRSPVLHALRTSGGSRGSPSNSTSASPSVTGSNLLTPAPPLSSHSSHRSSTGSSSPMPVEALEYFSETAARLGTGLGAGGGGGASGMMIQSHDGKPAGIFFQPIKPPALGRRSNSAYSHGSAGTRRSGASRGGGSGGANTPAAIGAGGNGTSPNKSGEVSPHPSSASASSAGGSAGSSNQSNFRRRISGGSAGGDVQDDASTAAVTSPRARPLAKILDESGTAGETPSERQRRLSSEGANSMQLDGTASDSGQVTPLTSSNLEHLGDEQSPQSDGTTAEPPTLASRNGVGQDSAGPSTSSSLLTARSPATDWQSAPPGTLFSPQVGIDQVLAAKSPPLATPISQPFSSASLAPQSSGASASTSLQAIAGEESRDSDVRRQQGIEMSRGPSPAVPTPPLPVVRRVSASRRADEANSTAPQPGATATASRQAERTEHDNANVNDAINESTSPEQPVSVPPSAAAASTAAASTGAGPSSGVRPSAQPQSGLLIGAGFAPTTRRGAPSRRAAVREKVLPPIKVLIVEDNPINQRILKQFMNRKRIQSEVAVNGREAVDKWATGGFHLILMDIQLPVMDGIEATKEIRRREMSEGVVPPTSPSGGPTSGGQGRLGVDGMSTTTTGTSSSASSTSLTTPNTALSTPASTPFRASVIIVALTASSLNSDKVAALSSGCNDFLQKPVSLVWLEKKIIEWGSMQYIVGYLGEEQRRAIGAGSSAGKRGGYGTSGAGPDVRKAFGKAPDVKARQLASRLHLPATKAK
ncbi:hypothetical protein BDZ90DRAFT_232845 [Jaminaea rosea]|uniref:Response regulatory domain-containing protein n=1 Tax=Jaminaea rosea TaxID=1569628 RepID=A0A316UP35_9BASI|nr:hypothetical protein BDZ90DRAFT_232845 [Jaminaea rosea]PWN26724.1 hypothetical protein BDZ90DRAFT_232845 [Jaminaea rosea]